MWLVKKGHTIQAKKSLAKLRGPKYDERVELSELENLSSSNDKLTIAEKLKELSSRRNVIPFLIIAIFMMLQVRTNPFVYILKILKHFGLCKLFFSDNDRS